MLDIQDAFEWYEKIRDRLGIELIQEIEICYYKISKHPEHYGFISEKYRSIRIKRFPYLIIFEIIDNNGFVYNFLHAKRKTRNR